MRISLIIIKIKVNWNRKVNDFLEFFFEGDELKKNMSDIFYWSFEQIEKMFVSVCVSNFKSYSLWYVDLCYSFL